MKSSVAILYRLASPYVADEPPQMEGTDRTNGLKETPRQRSIMSLSAQGKNPQDIALSLDLSYSYVRKELSRAYAVLLPDADQSSDLKTAAVLKFMELMRMR